MGINKTAADDFDADLARFKANNPTATRAQKRKYALALSQRASEFVFKSDAADNAAPADFAASKAGQFKTFTDALPEPALDPVDPQS